MKSIFLCLVLGVAAVSAHGGGWGERFGPRDPHGHHSGGPPREVGHHHGRKPTSGCPAPQCKDSQDPCKVPAEENKRIVLEFYTQVFQKGNLSAVDEYYCENIIQHNPTIKDGKQAFLDFVSGMQPAESPILRPAADCDIVYLHVKSGDPAKPLAIVDIFRLQCGKICEHWDVMQMTPDESANSHPMFENA